MSVSEESPSMVMTIAGEALRVAHLAAGMKNPEAHKFIVTWLKENKNENLDNYTNYISIWSAMKMKRKADREAKAADRHE